MAQFDTIIKGGIVFDGTKEPRFVGDIGIKDGFITEIDRDGQLDPAFAEKVIDAEGMHVCPGFIDLHTHYDAQIQWDPYATLSGWHGVTSIAIGNCGFGFAPIAPELRERAMLMMSRVEAIPFESMKLGMTWDWESFPEWLDHLERIPLGINVLSYVPISPIMITVMGIDDAKNREPTKEEITEMCRLLEEGLDAGGCGWSVQRLGKASAQRDYDGTPMVTDEMSDELCLAFAEVLGRREEGAIQLTQTGGLRFVEKLAQVADKPILYNAVQSHDKVPGSFRKIMGWLHRTRARGNENIWGMAIFNGNEEYFSFDEYNLLDGSRAWRTITLGTVEERITAMQNDTNRGYLRKQFDAGKIPSITGPVQDYKIDKTFLPENKQWEGKYISEVAEAQGKHVIDTLLDLIISEDLKTVFWHRSFNEHPGYNKEILDADFTIPGVSDGGAHTKFITAGKYPTEFLINMVRRDGMLSLEDAHYRLSAMPAQCAGFKDRGTLVEGAPADILVYDYQNLKITPDRPEVVYDFPGDAWRLVQYAEGYRYIMVNGTVTFKDGECTDATPGQLLRFGKASNQPATNWQVADA